VITGEIAGITFEGVSFDSQTHHLMVADQPNGPGTLYPDAVTAGRSFGGLAAVNAGFFTPEGAPLGLVASSGRLAGSWNAVSSLGSGVWYTSTTGNTAIARRGSFRRPDASTMRELIQAGPLLVENGRTVSGLESTKTSARTLILWDGDDQWWIGRTSPCTLAALGNAIATGQLAAWPTRSALNLDGGRSSDLWISGAVTGGPMIRRPVWNRPVRNFLVLLPK
jgi:exopolysaccharide biosynthesis protein